MTLPKSGPIASIFCLAALLLPTPLPAQIVFERSYGGPYGEHGNSVQQTADGGYIIAGVGGIGIYLVKTDACGDTLWTRAYGGTGEEDGRSVRQTADGGYIVTGSTSSYGAGYSDVYLLKLDSIGDTVWTRTFGGYAHDAGHCVRQTLDGGYIIAGETHSYGVGGDAWLIRTDAAGKALWTRTYGGDFEDRAYSVLQTADSGYIAVGSRDLDVYLIRTDAAGDTLWTRTFVESLDLDEGCSVLQSTDGGYVVCGYTFSLGAGEADIYLIKTNSVGDTIWTRTFGGEGSDFGYSILAAADGGFLVAGQLWASSEAGNDACLIRVTAGGDALWTRTYGGASTDYGNAAQRTEDGGYVIAGGTRSYGAGGTDVYLIKTDSLGRTAVEEPETPLSRAPALSLICEPNPCRGTTRISFKPQASSPRLLTLRVYDAQGRMVLSHQVSTSSFLLSTSDLPSGTYFARLDYGTHDASSRLVLQR